MESNSEQQSVAGNHPIPRGSAAPVLAVPQSDSSMSGITSGHFPSQEAGDPNSSSPAKTGRTVADFVAAPTSTDIVTVDAIAGKRQKKGGTPSVMSLDLSDPFVHGADDLFKKHHAAILLHQAKFMEQEENQALL